MQQADIVSCKEAWNRLMNGDKRVYSRLGFFALGDAESISGAKEYKHEIVLVERREKHQYNHWGYRCKRSECKYQPSIFTNGDDGMGGLKRKAPRLKLLSEE
jgi:hypothetical protein